MSNFSCIGFPVQDKDSFFELINKVYPLGVQYRVNEGAYILYSDSSGAQLWMQVNSSGQLIGVNPHFRGLSKFTVFITNAIESEESELDGSCHAWAAPTDESNPESGAYPFVFDMPDYRLVDIAEIKGVHKVQITAFAQQIDMYDTEDEFYNSQSSDIKFSSQSFIPSGLFTEKEFRAEGSLSGRIIDFSRLQNQYTKTFFYWLYVETLGGLIDIVYDINITDKQPQVGGIVRGVFWLSGRVLSKKEVKKNFFQKLFSTVAD
ncbi:MAG: hypothetical protein H6550_12115 [Chitinophagales bacterium]|nr:hypothetical protein [Chitinophagales bacterium]